MATNISENLKITTEAIPYMNCLNDFRRFENSFEGMRYFDLKRWGLEWTHYQGNEKTPYTMAGIDVRRAMEAPWEALANGAGSSREQMPAATRSIAMEEMRMPSIDKFRTDSIN
jgi:hypothetical protein